MASVKSEFCREIAFKGKYDSKSILAKSILLETTEYQIFNIGYNRCQVSKQKI